VKNENHLNENHPKYVFVAYLDGLLHVFLLHEVNQMVDLLECPRQIEYPKQLQRIRIRKPLHSEEPWQTSNSIPEERPSEIHLREPGRIRDQLAPNRPRRHELGDYVEEDEHVDDDLDVTGDLQRLHVEGQGEAGQEKADDVHHVRERVEEHLRQPVLPDDVPGQLILLFDFFGHGFGLFFEHHPRGE